MKRGKALVNLNLRFSNKAVYTIIAVIIIIAAAGIAFAYGTNSPSTFGHSSGEVDVVILGTTYTLQQAIDMNLIGGGAAAGTLEETVKSLEVTKAKGKNTTYPGTPCDSGWTRTGCSGGREAGKKNVEIMPEGNNNCKALFNKNLDNGKTAMIYTHCARISDSSTDSEDGDSAFCKASCGGVYNITSTTSTIQVANQMVYETGCTGTLTEFTGPVKVCSKI